MPMTPFLEDRERRPLQLPDSRGLRPIGLVLGKGPNALEVAIAESDRRPAAPDLRSVWRSRLAGRATPLLLVALYSGGSAPTTGSIDKLAALCGPSGDHPPLHYDLDPAQVERICASALDEPDRHAALRLLLSILPELELPVLGLHNEGFFATHELHTGVPRRVDWERLVARSTPILDKRGRELLAALGFIIEQHPGPISVLKVAGTKVAIALLLERGETPDAPGPLFSGASPIAYAMAKADEERVRYVLVSSGPMLRAYPTGTGVGTGRRGRTETYVDVRLDLLAAKQAGYLWLLFSADALRDGGTAEQILDHSKDYAADLGKRLRERIHTHVIPGLATGLMSARRILSPTVHDLSTTYQMALMLLFRLLFVAYAEDKDLLPYRSNELYRTRSLKQKARELLTITESKRGFGEGTTHWEEIQRLFHAVDKGMQEWSVPEYNGGLFSSDAEVSPIGAAFESVSLDNTVLGPVLAELLLDHTDEGRGPVDFRSLGVREFGTIYEGLLENELSVAETNLTLTQSGEYQPVRRTGERVEVPAGSVYLHNASGARKTTGSYFTKQFAVEHLLDHALEPALRDHVSRLDTLDERAAGEAFFDFRVADIAMGSGHFLVAAVDRIERSLSDYLARRPLPEVAAELARLKIVAHGALAAVGMDVDIEDTQLLRRQITRRCVYGVDLNPLAVELAKLSLWIHTFVPGLPLSFLDSNLVVGNSLVGIATVDEARELLREMSPRALFAMSFDRLIGSARETINQLARLSDATAAEIGTAREMVKQAREAVASAAALFDVLTAARLDEDLQREVDEHANHWVDNLTTVPKSGAYEMARKALDVTPPLHFPISFPGVFLREQSGFDVIIGNPPWEKAKVEDNSFWARYSPGYKSLTQVDREAEKRRLRRERPDLVAVYERELREADLLRDLLISGAFPGMSTGDPDLYKAFCWRFWNLVCEDGGRIGVVLPRSALAAKGSTEFRREVFSRAEAVDVTTLLNRGGWVFDEAEHRYTIGLVAVVRREAGRTPVALRGPYPSLERYADGMVHEPAVFYGQEIQTWTETAALPLLPSEESAEVFTQLRRAPRLELNDGKSWRARPHRELDATNDKELMRLTERQPEGYWPIFKGESFDIWVSDTGTYYAWADPEKVMKALQERRMHAARLARSAFSEFSEERITDPRTLPCLQPRIAFRDVTRSTDSRTVRAALVPPNIFLTHKAPYFLWPRGDDADEAYLLGVLCSIPLDWYARRFVEVSLTYHILGPFPVPRVTRENPLRKRTVDIAGRLAAQDRRFRKWAAAVGVPCGPLAADEKDDLVHELDAVVAHLYGLTEAQLRHIFETFHEGWDDGARLEATLGHYRAWIVRR